jgi:hypothetical protein
MPEVWPFGRSFVLITRFVPLRLTDQEALGHVTAPATAILVVESHVFAEVLIQGPMACAPPKPPPNWVWHE